ncbi:MAG: hypothetical protein HPY72_07830 [Anaerolineae bacterium]|jgi:hypothetical protein|nr:hypothetical protein [Anaerolineae bacterium]
MALELLNGSLVVDIFYDPKDREFEDNICVCLKEFGPDEEKILYANETNIYLTAEEARAFSDLLLEAADKSSHASR